VKQSNINVLYLDNKKTIQSPYYNLKTFNQKFSCKLLNNQRRQPNLIMERKQSNSFGRLKIGKKIYVIYTRGSKDGYKIFTYDETNFMYNYINVQSQFSKY
jgi:hypothetical protein